MKPAASPRARIRPWVQAARPIAHPMIFVPLFLGQAFAFRTHGALSLTFFLYALLFGVVYQVYLLYLNDYADEAVDRTNDQYFLSGGSRVLPEGKLEPQDLLIGARLALLCLLGLAGWLGIYLDRPWFPLGAALAVTLCWAYNSKPLRLSYRGHGEMLQGLGCGVLLPLVGFYLQYGSLQGFPWPALVPLFLLFHAGNIVTALPDYPSDKAGDKRTLPVRRGEPHARKAVLMLLTLAYLCTVVAKLDLTPTDLLIIVMPAALLLAGVMLSGNVKRADASNFASCKRFMISVSASQVWFLCAWIGVLLLSGSP
ncbi:MAG: prenyltransferase [Pseudomonadota bacterium]